jgi:hypothetical protein
VTHALAISDVSDRGTASELRHVSGNPGGSTHIPSDARHHRPADAAVAIAQWWYRQLDAVDTQSQRGATRRTFLQRARCSTIAYKAQVLPGGTFDGYPLCARCEPTIATH